MKNEFDKVIGAFTKAMTDLVDAEVERQVQDRLQQLIAGAGGASQPVARLRPFGTGNVSLKQRRARLAQGKYLGALKRLKGGDRQAVKRTAKEKGVAEAVQHAQQLLS